MGYREMTHQEYDIINRLHPAAESAIEKYKVLHSRLLTEPENRPAIFKEIMQVQKWYENEIS